MGLFHQPHEQESVIAGPVGNLQVLLTQPEQAADTACVICHPHPLYGGTMHNKVVHSVARVSAQLNYMTVRFNFRGVGQSAGEFDHGRGETEDVAAVIEYLQQQFGITKWVLVGFSFGAFVAYRYATLTGSVSLQRLILIAPPVTMIDMNHLPDVPGDWLVIQGMQDEIIAATAVLQWTEQRKNPPRVQTLANASHFFHGQLTELKQLLREYLQDSQ